MREGGREVVRRWLGTCMAGMRGARVGNELHQLENTSKKNRAQLPPVVLAAVNSDVTTPVTT
jgi:hypothetical protein